MDDSAKKLKSNIKTSVLVLFVVLTVVGTWFCSTALGAVPDATAEREVTTVTTAPNPEVVKYALIGAAIAFGLGAMGAGFAISHVGAAAMGAVAEKPEVFGQALIFVALAEGIVVFSFITALMILNAV
jgi:V/A-type H+-transporting ATPase subunit K